jgi:hypothetical protein
MKSAGTLTEGVNRRERVEVFYLTSILHGARRDITMT